MALGTATSAYPPTPVHVTADSVAVPPVEPPAIHTPPRERGEECILRSANHRLHRHHPYFYSTYEGGRWCFWTATDRHPVRHVSFAFRGGKLGSSFLTPGGNLTYVK